MLGVEARATLLRDLGKSLLAHPDALGPEGRPGNLFGMKFPIAYLDSSLM